MAFDPSELPAGTLSTLLEAGSWVLVEETKGKLARTTAGTLIDASPDDVRAAIEDFASYKEWMPQLVKSDVVTKKGKTADVAFTVSFRFGLFSKSLDYTVRYAPKGDTRLEWERVSGDFDENHGAWTWISLDRGKRTAVFYSFYVDLAGTGSMVKLALKASPQMEVAIATSTAILVARSLKSRVESA